MVLQNHFHSYTELLLYKSENTFSQKERFMVLKILGLEPYFIVFGWVIVLKGRVSMATWVNNTDR